MRYTRSDLRECTYHLICEDPIEMVIVQTDHPLETLDLVVLKSPANEDRGLLRDLLLDPMRDRIIVHLRLVLVVLEPLRAKRRLVRRALLAIEHRLVHRHAVPALLLHDRLRERVEVRVRLLEQVRDARVLRCVDELHVRLLVVRLERLQPFFRDALDALLLLLLRVRVEREHRAPEARHAVRRRAPDSLDLLPVRRDHVELLDVLLLRAALALRALAPLELLGRPRVLEVRLADPAEVDPVEREERPVRQALCDLRAHRALLVEQPEALELDQRPDLSVRAHLRL